MSSIFFDNFFDWMLLNLILALIPLILSLLIFHRGTWEGNLYMRPFLILLTLVFFVFLPNAPYTLTDIVHLVRQIKEYRYFGLTDNLIITVLIPQYVIFIFLGFSCYVIAFQNFLVFLSKKEVSFRVLRSVKLLVPLFMAIGVFLGRKHRYSSWDILFHFPSMIKILFYELHNLSFYVYIIYFYSVIVILFELFFLFYRSVWKELFCYRFDLSKEISKRSTVEEENGEKPF